MPTRARKRLSISQQFSLFLVPTMCVAFILGVSGAVYLRYNEQQKVHARARQEIIETFVNSLAKPLWDCDPATTKNVLSVTAQWPTVASVELEDLCAGTTHFEEEITDSDAPDGTTTRSTDVVYIDEYSEPHNVGRLTIQFRDASVWDLAVEQLIGDTLLLFFSLSAILAVAFLANRRIISRPLRRFATIMDEYSVGRDVDLDAFLNRNDELGDVVKAYDVLIHEVNTRYTRKLKLAECARLLLSSPANESSGIEGVLGVLVETLNLDRVDLFQNVTRDGVLCMERTHATYAPGNAPQADNPDQHYLPYEPDFVRWRDSLAGKQSVYGNIKDFPLQEKEILVSQSVRSVFALPIWTSVGWWGFCGMYDTHNEREWSWGDLVFLETIADIIGTHLQRADAESQLHKFYYSVENSPASIFITNLAGTIEYVNPAFCDNTGYARTEVIGQTPRILKSGLHEDAFYEDMWQTVSARNTWRGEICNRSKSGEHKWVMAVISVVLNEKGEPTHFLSIEEDITDRKNIDRLKEDVDRIMRHDLKSPLNAIVNVPSLLISEGGLSTDQVELLTAVEESGRLMVEMIDSSLDLLKMEHGSYESYTTTIDLVGKISAVFTQNGVLLNRGNIVPKITIDGMEITPETTFEIQADDRQLYTMLSNLVVNAIEASPIGATLDIRLKTNPHLTLSIVNTGVVPEAIRERFFDKFVTAGKKNGTGLGTYSAKLIAEALGYDITMNASDEKNETVITVTMSGID